MSQPIKIYEPSKRQFKPFKGIVQNQLPCSARFHIQAKSDANQSVRLVFNSRIVKSMGLGDRLRSVDLHWSEGTQEILLKFFSKEFRGERRVSPGQRGYTACIAVTMFLNHFGIRFKARTLYRAHQMADDEIIVDLSGPMEK